MKHSKGLSILFVSLFTIGSFASTIPFMLKNTTPQDEIIDGGNGENSESELTKEQQKVKDVADYITVSNDEDGVAKVIEKFFNNNLN